MESNNQKPAWSLRDTIADSVFNRERASQSKASQENPRQPILQALASRMSQTTAGQFPRAFAEEAGGMVKKVAQGTARGAISGVASMTADPYNLATKGEPTKPFNVPGVGEVKTTGRKADEYASEAYAQGGDKFSVAAAGTRAFSEGMFDVASVAALATLAKHGLKEFLGSKESIGNVKQSVTGQNMQGGYESTFKAGEKIPVKAAQGRIADAATKLDSIQKGLGDKLMGLIDEKNLVLSKAGDYPQITQAAGNVLREYLTSLGGTALLPGLSELADDVEATITEETGSELLGAVGAAGMTRKQQAGRVQKAIQQYQKQLVTLEKKIRGANTKQMSNKAMDKWNTIESRIKELNREMMELMR
jgi:hypothetical protein